VFTHTEGVSKSRSVRTLQRTLYVLAVIPVVAGASTVLLGSESVPAAGKPTASIESELRFYSVWWIGAGLFLAWLAPRIEERTRELRVFCALLFLAGLIGCSPSWTSAGHGPAR
jgi:hypothetical protein